MFMFMFMIRRRNTSIPLFSIRRYHSNKSYNNNNNSSSSSSCCNGGLRHFFISSQKLIIPPSYAAAAAAYSHSSFTTTTCNHHKWAEEEEDEESDNAWEEEEDDDDELNAQPGDGRAGGGVLLNALPWGQRALSIAHELLISQFGPQPDFKLFAFRTTPRGYIYLRLDKLPNLYGCPSIDELQSYHREYKTRLDQLGATGEIPDDLAIEVSSPGAHRLLKVPDDLDRFKQLPMRVCYVQDLDPKAPLKNGVFLLQSVDTESGHCVWKLANVRENRDIAGKGRPLNRKQKDWRLNLPYAMVKKVTLYLD